MFQEKQSTPNFQKTNISYPLMRTRTCAYQGVRNVGFFPTPWYAHVRVRIRGKEMLVFRKIWCASFSCNIRFEIRAFVLLPTKCCCILAFISTAFHSTAGISLDWKNLKKSNTSFYSNFFKSFNKNGSFYMNNIWSKQIYIKTSIFKLKHYETLIMVTKICNILENLRKAMKKSNSFKHKV